MFMRSASSNRWLGLILTAAATLPAASFGQTWDGGGLNNNWTTANNWNPNGVPANDGTAVVAFGGTVRLTPVVNLSQSVRGIGFVNGAGAFNIVSDIPNHFLLIGASGIANLDADSQTISCLMRLAADQIWDARVGDLVLGSAGIDGAGFELSIRGNFDTTLGTVGSSNTSLVKSGSGVLTLGPGNQYHGATTISGGTLRPSASNSLPDLTSVDVVSGSLDLQHFTDTVNAYTQGSNGKLAIEIGGTTPGTDFARLAVTNAASLNGTLIVSLINAFDPAPGTAFDILTAGSISGSFAAVNVPTLPSLKGWRIEYLPTAVRLEVVDCGPGDADGDGIGDACDLELNWNTLDGGGIALSTGGNLELSGTLGQPDAGVMTGGNITLTGGFWSAILPGVPPMPGDCDADGDIDLSDLPTFAGCMTGPGGTNSAGCSCADLDGDLDVDLADFARVQGSFGP